VNPTLDTPLPNNNPATAGSAGALQQNPVEPGVPPPLSQLVWNGLAPPNNTYNSLTSKRPILVARLDGPFPTSGVWFPDQGIGSGTSVQSSANLDEAAGPPMLFEFQEISDFILTVANGPSSDEEITIWVKPNATGVWEPTAVVLELPTGDVTAETAAGVKLSLVRGDQICAVLGSTGGFSPGTTQLWGAICPTKTLT